MQGFIVESGIWREMAILGDLTQVQRVLDDVKRALVCCQFSDREMFCITVALEEALVNAIKHGNQMDRAKKVFIRYAVEENRFHIMIRDEGPGFDPEDVPDPTAVENLERPCGRGLMLMRYYMTEVEYSGGGNVVTMSKVFRNNGQK